MDLKTIEPKMVPGAINWHHLSRKVVKMLNLQDCFFSLHPNNIKIQETYPYSHKSFNPLISHQNLRPSLHAFQVKAHVIFLFDRISSDVSN